MNSSVNPSPYDLQHESLLDPANLNVVQQIKLELAVNDHHSKSDNLQSRIEEYEKHLAKLSEEGKTYLVEQQQVQMEVARFPMVYPTYILNEESLVTKKRMKKWHQKSLATRLDYLDRVLEVQHVVREHYRKSLKQAKKELKKEETRPLEVILQSEENRFPVALEKSVDMETDMKNEEEGQKKVQVETHETEELMGVQHVVKIRRGRPRLSEAERKKRELAQIAIASKSKRPRGRPSKVKSVGEESKVEEIEEEVIVMRQEHGRPQPTDQEREEQLLNEESNGGGKRGRDFKSEAEKEKDTRLELLKPMAKRGRPTREVAEEKRKVETDRLMLSGRRERKQRHDDDYFMY